MQVKMWIKGLTTKETSFKTHRNENQTEDTGQNLEYDRGVLMRITGDKSLDLVSMVIPDGGREFGESLDLPIVKV